MKNYDREESDNKAIKAESKSLEKVVTAKNLENILAETDNKPSIIHVSGGSTVMNFFLKDGRCSDIISGEDCKKLEGRVVKMEKTSNDEESYDGDGQEKVVVEIESESPEKVHKISAYGGDKNLEGKLSKKEKDDEESDRIFPADGREQTMEVKEKKSSEEGYRKKASDYDRNMEGKSTKSKKSNDGKESDKILSVDGQENVIEEKKTKEANDEELGDGKVKEIEESGSFLSEIVHRMETCEESHKECTKEAKSKSLDRVCSTKSLDSVSIGTDSKPSMIHIGDSPMIMNSDLTMFWKFFLRDGWCIDIIKGGDCENLKGKGNKTRKVGDEEESDEAFLRDGNKRAVEETERESQEKMHIMMMCEVESLEWKVGKMKNENNNEDSDKAFLGDGNEETM